jgi:hypothetical protein
VPFAALHKSGTLVSPSHGGRSDLSRLRFRRQGALSLLIGELAHG